MRTVLDAMEEHSASRTREKLEALAADLTAQTGIEHALYATPRGTAVFPATIGDGLYTRSAEVASPDA